MWEFIAFRARDQNLLYSKMGRNGSKLTEAYLQTPIEFSGAKPGAKRKRSLRNKRRNKGNLKTWTVSKERLDRVTGFRETFVDAAHPNRKSIVAQKLHVETKTFLPVIQSRGSTVNLREHLIQDLLHSEKVTESGKTPFDSNDLKVDLGRKSSDNFKNREYNRINPSIATSTLDRKGTVPKFVNNSEPYIRLPKGVNASISNETHIRSTNASASISAKNKNKFSKEISTISKLKIRDALDFKTVRVNFCNCFRG